MIYFYHVGSTPGSSVGSFMPDGNNGMMFLSPNMSAFLNSPAPNQTSAGETRERDARGRQEGGREGGRGGVGAGSGRLCQMGIMGWCSYHLICRLSSTVQPQISPMQVCSDLLLLHTKRHLLLIWYWMQDMSDEWGMGIKFHLFIRMGMNGDEWIALGYYSSPFIPIRPHSSPFLPICNCGTKALSPYYWVYNSLYNQSELGYSHISCF